jgi:hypothetical protein
MPSWTSKYWRARSKSQRWRTRPALYPLRERRDRIGLALTQADHAADPRDGR